VRAVRLRVARFLTDWAVYAMIFARGLIAVAARIDLRVN
jgi:hypothetical protein